MRITIVSGARPNFMKIAPICRAIDAAREAGKNISYRIVYTGPQDDTSLDASLFSDLSMRKPDAYLGVTGHNHSQVAAPSCSPSSGSWTGIRHKSYWW
jgi:UDP-N-acetylglucosamine 2-epimerase (non-hydrolysing)